ncbi:hypothetical protein J5N97_011163 [Dioscorea zingiberensis]|uniref:Glycosyltransferase family 92 protein n=1 Tax=Dioscorea zingiberensis TaxID=325984 RepID=A0A9D5HNC3_9LILI|nr:hypothetical protein J5N97_011163 [Dioscorea zingiberensis]
MSKEKSMEVGMVWSLVDVKLLLTSLLVLCSLATVLQLLPSLSCLSSSTTTSQSQVLNFSTPNPPKETLDLHSGIVKRAFNAVGSAAYLFIQMGAYRGGANTFAIVGLGSKPLHVFSNPTFRCVWIPHSDTNRSIATTGYKILPDWGYDRVYTVVVVVNCTFPDDVGVDGSGGQLVVHATTGGGGYKGFDLEENFVALDEKPGSFNLTELTAAPPKHDILYCYSSLYGNLSPQRVREWMTYHLRLFGPRAHFVFHDAGGVHPEVLDVLRPWMAMGILTLQDIREQERFDGYYHNQFLIVNDCLHRYRHAAKWMFFFDIDEFLYIKPKSTLRSLLDSLSGYTQFTIEQMPMSNKLCLSSDAGKTPRMWGFEKLVYRDVKRGVRRDRKYAIQPRNVFATGVHMSQNVAGRTLHKLDGRIKYFHYHGTISDRREPCRQFVNATDLTFENAPYVFDNTLRVLAGSVKRYELKAIGSGLSRTRQ